MAKTPTASFRALKTAQNGSFPAKNKAPVRRLRKLCLFEVLAKVSSPLLQRNASRARRFADRARRPLSPRFSTARFHPPGRHSLARGVLVSPDKRGSTEVFSVSVRSSCVKRRSLRSAVCAVQLDPVESYLINATKSLMSSISSKWSIASRISSARSRVTKPEYSMLV